MNEAKSKLRYLLGREPKDAEAEWMRDQLAAAREEGRRAGLEEAQKVAATLKEDIVRRVRSGDDQDAMLGSLDTLERLLEAKLEQPRGTIPASGPGPDKSEHSAECETTGSARTCAACDVP